MTARASQADARISIVLCTRNRAAQARACLQQFRGDAFDDRGIEWVLVDSASEDGTPAVLAEFGQAHPRRVVKVLRASRPGLSLARNAGVGASSGALIVFLDDDVILGEGYLERVRAHFAVSNDRVGVVSGRILRQNPEDSLYGCQLSRRHREFGRRAILRPGLIQGANLAARRSVFDDVGGFDPELGAGARFRCEDVDFVARALERGWRVVYDPDVVVHHDHGRREGEALDGLREENSVAAGAYVAKMIGLGARRYWALLAAMLLASPWRPNLRARSVLAGFRAYRASRHGGAP